MAICTASAFCILGTTAASKTAWNIVFLEALASKFPLLVLVPAPLAAATSFFKAWGETDVAEAKRLIDICFEAGVNLFDTADGYLGRPIRGDPGQGPRWQARPGADFHQGPISRRVRGRTTKEVRAITFGAPSKPACGGSAPTTSTSTICTGLTRSHPSKKCRTR